MTRTRISFFFAILMALISSALLVLNSAHTQQGVPVLPLDDSYIHLQYGWQAAHGQFLRYTTGDTPSSGATSLLYMLVVASGFALGITREAMPSVELFLGVALFITSTLMLVDLLRRLIPNNITALVLGGILFSASGWMAWSFMSGMETGLLITLSVGALWAIAARRQTLVVLFTSLAILTRPEVIIFALAIASFDLWEQRHQIKSRLVFAAIPLLAFFISPLVNFIFTGSFSASGFSAKSWFTVLPFLPDRLFMAIGKTILEFIFLLFGGLSTDGRFHTFPLMQLLAFIGFWVMWRSAATRRLAWVIAVWVIGGITATATLQNSYWQHFRYQMPLYPALLIAFIFGVMYFANRFKINFWIIIGVAAAWSIYSVRDFTIAYSFDTHTAQAQQMSLANWLHQNTTPTAKVAVSDVGLIGFLSERRTIDAVGLTSSGLWQSNRNGPGAVYEAIERQRPDYYAVYADSTVPYYGIATARDLFGDILFEARVDPFSPYTSAAARQIISRPDWSAATVAVSPQQPNIVARTSSLTLIDSIDVADIVEEQAHGYAWWNTGDVKGFISDARRMKYRYGSTVVMDGGRIFNGGESFMIKTQPNKDVLLVARLHQTENLVATVKVDDQIVGEWKLPMVAGEWLEAAYPIPAKFVRGASSRITISLPPESRYSPFYYWAYQGEIAPSVLPTKANISFGDVARLINYDVARRGDQLIVTLRWQAVNPLPNNYRIFLHVIDPSNDSESGIVAQSDAPPFAGTYPFWVWGKDEMVSETIALMLAPNTQSKEYALLLGVYDADSGERLTFVGAEDFGSNRLKLSAIR